MRSTSEQLHHRSHDYEVESNLLIKVELVQPHYSNITHVKKCKNSPPNTAKIKHYMTTR